MHDKEILVCLAGIQNGDESSFDLLYHELKTLIFTVILRIVGDSHLAEDVLQDFFVRLYLSPPASSLHKPRAYLLQMARNLAIDALRKQSQTDTLETVSDTAADLPDYDRRLDLQSALHALPLPEREVIILHINGGLRFREIASIVSRPLGTVLWQYQHGLQNMRRKLEVKDEP